MSFDVLEAISYGIAIIRTAIAKKYLGVPASAAHVERMFSIAGHIINIKRRRMGVKLFTMLVMLKLNDSKQ